MPELIDAPAPAAPPTPPTPIAATDAAFANKNFGDYREARAAEVAGKPLPPVAVAPEVPAAPVVETPPAPVENRRAREEKEQQRINDAIRRGIDAELARRGVAPPAPAPVAQPPAPVGEKFPSLEAWGKANPTGSFEDYMDARDTWREARRTAEVQQQRAQAADVAELRARNDAYGAKISAASAEDKAFLASLPESARNATPISGCLAIPNCGLIDPATQQPAAFGNVVAEVATRSDDPVAFYRYLHSHQDETVAVAQGHPQRWFEALTRLDGRIAAGRAPSSTSPATPPAEPTTPATPSPVSAFPPPTPTLTTKPGATADPTDAALRTKNFSAYRASREAERMATVRAR